MSASRDVEAPQVPTRHREAETRGERIARPLRMMTGLREPADEALLDRLGAGLMERDEFAHDLAVAMLLRVGAQGRVSRAQCAAALGSGLEAVGDDAPPALARFMEAVSATPSWVDWDLVDRGASVFNRLGRNAGDVLLMLSLTGGYRFGGPPDLLVATGALTGDSAMQRLAETQHWVLSLMVPGALQPGGDAWRQTLHVRVMHAMVNATFESSPDWDVARWGLPINQTDQAGTLGLFGATVILASRGLGVPIAPGDARALLHLWKYVGWLMGVHPDFLSDVERERNWLNLHILLAAADQTDAGRELARTIVRVQPDRRYGIPHPLLSRARGRYEQERLLSMLTVLLGPASMRELGLPLRPPWAYAARLATNVWSHRVVGRLPGGRDALERRGRAVQLRDHSTYLPVGTKDGVADLPDRPARKVLP
ncbi:oxygenase MpaB family protein [Knoellia sp. CPCC 206453]|uniref:oxygenase MpaB family protein n=1 Tax=Knoellia pratensis TaxID=3404796 RepID=UPI0036110ACF